MARRTKLLCAGCRSAVYCCRAHQLLHWRAAEGGHKHACSEHLQAELQAQDLANGVPPQ